MDERRPVTVIRERKGEGERKGNRAAPDINAGQQTERALSIMYTISKQSDSMDTTSKNYNWSERRVVNSNNARPYVRSARENELEHLDAIQQRVNT